MREVPPIYSIRIEEVTSRQVFTTLHEGPIAELISGLLANNHAMRQRIESADSRTYWRDRSIRRVRA